MNFILFFHNQPEYDGFDQQNVQHFERNWNVVWENDEPTDKVSYKQAGVEVSVDDISIRL